MEIETAKNVSGDLRVAYKLEAADYEALKALNDSPFWKIYRQVLIRTKDAYFDSTLAMRETNDILKTIGMVAGLNIAINQLPVLCAEYNKAQKKDLEKDPARSVPFKRG